MTDLPLDWQALPEGCSGHPAVRGRWIAVASLDRLAIWRDGARLAQAASTVRAPGGPAIGDDAVHWGPGRWHEDTGWQADEALLALCGHGQRVPRAWAWRSDGRRVLLTLAGDPRMADADGPQALLAEPDGGRTIPLRNDAGASAAACHLGSRLAIVGSARASVHDAGGRLRCRLDNPTPLLRVAADAEERLILAVETGRIGLHRSDDGWPIGRSQGRWIDAALTPDGRQVLAADLDGRLAALDVQRDLAVRWLPADDPVQSLALDDEAIVAVFMRGSPLRRARRPL